MKTVKRGTKKYLEVAIFLIILLLANYLLPIERSHTLWVVLGKNLSPYKSVKLERQENAIMLSFPEEIEGELIGDQVSGLVKFRIDTTEYFLPVRLLVKKVRKTGPKNYKPGSEVVDINTPLPIDYMPDDLVKVDPEWNYHGENDSQYLRKEAADALVEMFKEAHNNGCNLKLVSAFRRFSDQHRIYMRAIQKNGIEQKIVAKPGHSEHQLGTTVDIGSFSTSSENGIEFNETKEGIWLQKNAEKFGFRKSYTEENKEITGYIPEPWHYRYIGR